MNFRNTAFLFGLSLAMLWIFGLMQAYKRTPVDESFVMNKLQASTDAVFESISIQRKEKDKEPLDYQLVSTSGGWSLKKGDIVIRLDGDRVAKIIQQVRTAARVDNADIVTDPTQNGLANPQMIVTIKGFVPLHKARKDAKDDKDLNERREPREWVLKIGNRNPAKTLVWVSSSDRPGRVFGVSASSLDSLFFADVNILRPTRLFEFSDLGVKKLAVKEGKLELEIKKGEDDSWRFIKPPLGFAEYEEAMPFKEKGKEKEKEPEVSGLKKLVLAVNGLNVESVNDFVAPTADLAAYGLKDGEESMRIQVTTFDEKNPETLLVGKKVPEQKEEQFFARMANDMGVVKLTSKQLAAIRKAVQDPGEARSTNITSVDMKKVDKIKLKFGAEEIDLTRPPQKPWEMQPADPKAKAIKANDRAVLAILGALPRKREIQKFIDVPEDQAKKTDAELGFDNPRAVVTLFTDALAKPDEKKGAKKDDKKDDKDAKKDEKKEEKKEVKPALTLIFGKADKDAIPVKRIMQDGTVTRFTVSKAFEEKIIPTGDPRLALLDPSLPEYSHNDVASMTFEWGKQKLEFVRGKFNNLDRWMFKNPKARPEDNIADHAKVDFFASYLANLQARKWLQKFDAKTDLDKLGLKSPSLTATLVVKKLDAKKVASVLPFALDRSSLGGPLPIMANAALQMLASREADPGETIVITFGKETDQEKDKPGIFARHSASDMLFLGDPDLLKALKTEDLRDRSLARNMQSILDVSAVALGPWDLLAKVPLLVPTVKFLDPAKVKDVSMEMRTAEFRKFHFLRPDKEKPWQDQSGLAEFTLDSDRVNSFLERLSKLHIERLVTIVDGPRPEYKLGAKEATLKIDFTLDKGGPVTLTVGGRFTNLGYFAHVSSWPSTVFLIPVDAIDPYLAGTGYFGKDRVAAGE